MSNVPVPAGNFPAPRVVPLLYPGKRPASGFLLSHGTAHPLRFVRNGANPVLQSRDVDVAMYPGSPDVAIDRFLMDRGVAPLGSRYPVIGYGSNPVPGQLLEKFGPHTTLPVIFGHLSGCDVAYNLVSNFGYAFADLLVGAAFGRCEVGITFLDQAQLELMVESEQNYHLAYSPGDVHLESGHTIEGGPGSALYVFAGLRRVWVPSGFHGPAAVAEIECTDRILRALTQKEYLLLAIEQFELSRRGIHTAEEFSQRLLREANAPEVRGKLKFDLQNYIHNDPRSYPALAETATIVDLRHRLRTLADPLA